MSLRQRSNFAIIAIAALLALAGIVAALRVAERAPISSTAAADLEADSAAFFKPGNPGGPAFTGSLESFVADQFSGANLSGLSNQEKTAIRALFSAGQTFNPFESLTRLNSPALRNLNNLSDTRSAFRAIAGNVFAMLRAAFANVPGAIGDRLRAKLNQMDDSFGVGGGGGGGGGTS